jgi:Zn-dependent peptidase ImmA (M78 family)
MSDWLHGVRVPPLWINDIRSIASSLRSNSELSAAEPFPALHFLEWSMQEIVQNFDFEIVESLPDGDEARAFPDGAPHYPDGPVIQVLPHVYERAATNNGRARLTVLHECGHVLLHRHVAVHHRGPRGAELKPWENSEWQANQFAAELLMPVESFNSHRDLDDYIAEMGVSREAACNRALQLERTLKIPLPGGWPVQVFASSHKRKGVLL